MYRGRFPYVVADEGESRCVGEEEAFSTCLRGEVVLPFFERGSWVEGGEAREMLVFELEGERPSASSELDAEVFEDEDSCSGLRVDLSKASFLIVRRSFGRGDDVAGACGSVVSSEDIVSSRWNLSYPSFLYPSAYQAF